jgi:hypothetical protein
MMQGNQQQGQPQGQEGEQPVPSQFLTQGLQPQRLGQSRVPSLAGLLQGHY